jgi:hypothetical protein
LAIFKFKRKIYGYFPGNITEFGILKRILKVGSESEQMRIFKQKSRHRETIGKLTGDFSNEQHYRNRGEHSQILQP